MIPEQFCKIFRTSAPCGGVFLRSVVQVYYDRHKSAHGSGKPPYTPAVFTMVAQVAFIGFGFVSPYIQPCAAVANHRTHHHFHRTIRASHNAGFATNTTFLHDMNKPFITADSTIRADVSARCIFTLTANCRRGNVHTFNDMDTR